MSVPLNITSSHLRLGYLGYGVGVNAGVSSQTKLAADGRGSIAETKMSDFFCGDLSRIVALEGQTSTTNLNWNYGYNMQMYITPEPQPTGSSSQTVSGSLFFERLSTLPQNWPTHQCAINCSYWTGPIASPDQLWNMATGNFSVSITTAVTTVYRDTFNHLAYGYNQAVSSFFNITSAGRSDKRLKENIERIGTSPSNIPIYKFSYKGEPLHYTGTMAQDLIEIGMDHATILDSDGYYRVHYNMIDVDLELFDGF